MIILWLAVIVWQDWELCVYQMCNTTVTQVEACPPCFWWMSSYVCRLRVAATRSPIHVLGLISSKIPYSARPSSTSRTMSVIRWVVCLRSVNPQSRLVSCPQFSTRRYYISGLLSKHPVIANVVYFVAVLKQLLFFPSVWALSLAITEPWNVFAVN